MRSPHHAKVFIVGKNQATPFTVNKVGSHERHIDALFNRNGETCEALYAQIRDGKPSKSRPIIDMLTSRLEQRGVDDVLETNVICYSTPMSRDLASTVHDGGTQVGEEIFHSLLHAIRPPILIAHGKAVQKSLSRSLGASLPEPPKSPTEVACVRLSIGNYMPLVFVVPSLAMPAAARWAKWRAEHLDLVAERIAMEICGRGDERRGTVAPR